MEPSKEMSLAEGMELWVTYAVIREELRKEKLIRCNKDPQADFAEWLVAKVLGGTIVNNKTNQGFDVKAGDKMVQVKKTWKCAGNSTGILKNHLKLDCLEVQRPTHYAFVRYSADGHPESIILLDYEQVRQAVLTRSQLRWRHIEEAGGQVYAQPFHDRSIDPTNTSPRND